ncbi:MAG: hypothetical protein HGA61_01975 [Candidatus Moranbacteria bacterium]|nr:hypothetical protein [Candidatus Moranbacteria bacterium]
MINSHLVKRALIVFVYVILFALVGFLIYFIKTPGSTCSDGKKNQGEKNVDCGGPCNPCKANDAAENLSIVEKKFVSGGSNNFDVLIKISNPNELVGASSFHYSISLKDESGSILAAKEGYNYILPADSKYIAELGLSVSGGAVPVTVDFSIDGVVWSQLGKIEKPQLSVYNKKFQPDSGGIGSKAEGLVRNESPNDFKKIDIIVILSDEQGNLLAINTTQKENIRAQKEGSFVLTWPYGFSNIVRNMEVDVQTNVFDSENFSAGI